MPNQPDDQSLPPKATVTYDDGLVTGEFRLTRGGHHGTAGPSEKLKARVRAIHLWLYPRFLAPTLHEL